MKVTAPVRIDISAGWSDADPFRHEFGGAVLNAAINLRVSATLRGQDLISSLEKVPSNSGLGTSGALRTVYLVAANPSLLGLNKMELIKRVNVFENALVGQRAGFQDQAAAIFGGVNYWEFRKDGGIHRVPIPRQKVRHFYDRCVLVFTGDRHQSANVHHDVFAGHFMQHIFTIDRIKTIARKMVSLLGREDAMQALLNETWYLQKSLHERMESPMMKLLQKTAQGHYLACRATGAGGGGCMIFYVQPEKRRFLIEIFHRLGKKEKNLRVLPFSFDYHGIRLE